MTDRAPATPPQTKPALTPSVLPTRTIPNNNAPQSTTDRPSPAPLPNQVNAADEWFQFRNDNVNLSHRSAYIDVDPPFHISSLRDHESHDVKSTTVENPEVGGNESGPPYYGPPDTDSNAEAYRDVIDDLTVENKELKRKLKKYRRQQSTNVHGEKLFELRIHGLPPQRRRELEMTLQNFAASIGGSSNVDVTFTTRSSGQTSSGSVTASEHYQRVAEAGPGTVDSAYVSNSKSGLLSIPSFNSQPSASASRPFLNQSRPVRHQSMPEKVKKRIIVARLEQLFTGTSLFPETIGPTGWQPPKPVDGLEDAFTAGILSQGSREAPILPREVELSADPLKSGAVDGSNVTPGPTEVRNTPSRSASIDSGLAMPEQRPTGPMDIDLRRIQVPADNFYYIRHLGLSASDSDSRLSFSKPQGWIYLNVLTNMAQLHTLNVTPDFVKDAVANYSDKFQLSQDGQKLRWIGSSDSTVANAEGSSSEDTDKNYAHWDKRRRVDGSKGTDSVPSSSSNSGSKSRSRGGETSSGSGSQSNSNYLAYTALFSHDRDSSRESSDENMSDGVHEHFSSRAPQNARHGHHHENGRDLSMHYTRENPDGPIVFYNGAKFFTDLGGDPYSSNLSTHDPPAYQRMTSEVIGCAPSKTTQTSSRSQSSSGTMTTATDFEVSGLGGVQPGDNFLVKVSNRQRVSPPKSRASPAREVSPFSVPRSRVKKIIHSIPQSAISAFSNGNENEVSPAITPSSSPDSVSGAGASGTSSDESITHTEQMSRLRQRIAASRDRSVEAAAPQITLEPISHKHVSMPPSTLPPASCVFFPFSSDDSASSSMEDDHYGTDFLSKTQYQDHHNAPLLAPVPMSIHYSGDGGLNPVSLLRENSGETSGTTSAGHSSNTKSKLGSSGQSSARVSGSHGKPSGYILAGRRTVGKVPSPLRNQSSSEEAQDVVASDETEHGG